MSERNMGSGHPEGNGKPGPDELEKATMKGLMGQELPEAQKKEVEEFVSRFDGATDEVLSSFIPEAADLSFKEEALAREVIRRGLDVQPFLDQAKFRTTKSILRGEIE